MESTFISQIEAEPGNRLHQLIFADWLEEQGDIRARLLRMSECFVEYKIRCVIKDWGMPGFDTLTSFDVMESDDDKGIVTYDKWMIQGYVPGAFFDVTLYVGDGVLLQEVSRETGNITPLDENFEHMMPPGWIGHKSNQSPE